MVRLTRILAALFLLPSLALAQQRVGPLDARNDLAEIAKAGPAAQAAARANLGLATVAASGAYGDLTGRPALAPVATSGAYGDLLGLPLLGALARLGVGAGLTSDGNSLSANVLSVAGRTGAVTLAAGDVSGLATVATSGRYADLSGLPAIPTDNSQIANGAGYVTSAGAASAAPVQSVAGRTGVVSLGVADVAGAAPAANPTITGGTFSGGDISAQTLLATGGSASAKLADRAGDELNLRRDFGAKGDGVTDDTAAVRAFMAACQTGRACFAPAGVYLESGFSLAPTAGGVIRGAGAGSTIFRLKSGTTGPHITYTAAAGFGNQSRMLLADLTIDGNNYTGSDGIYCAGGAGYALGPDLVRVTVLKPGRDGLYTDTNCAAGTTDNVSVSHPGRNALTVNAADWKHHHDLLYGADQAGYPITGAANNGAGLVRLYTTGAAHATAGQTVQVWATSGSGGFAANGQWTVAATDGATYVDLTGSSFTGTWSSGGRFVPLYAVSGVSNDGTGLVQISTSTPHGLSVGAQVLVENVGGVPGADGVWTVSAVPTPTTLVLANSLFGGTWTSGGTVQSVTVGVSVLSPGGLVCDDCNIYSNALGISLTASSASAATFASGSVDSNQIGGVIIQTNGVQVPHLFSGVHFGGNSTLAANIFPDFYISNTGAEILSGTFHTLSGNKASYLVQTDNNLVSQIRVVGVGFDSSGGARTPYYSGLTNDFTNVPLSASSASPIIGGTGSNSAMMADGDYAGGGDSVALGRKSSAFTYIGGAFGQFASDHNVNGWVFSGTQFASGGDGQIRMWNPLYAKTTDGTTTATFTTMGIGAATTKNVLNMQNNSVSVFPVLYCVAKNHANITDVAVWKLDGLIAAQASGASTATILHAPTITQVLGIGAAASLAAPTVAADKANGGIDIQDVGQASTTYDWMCSHQPIEMQ